MGCDACLGLPSHIEYFSAAMLPGMTSPEYRIQLLRHQKTSPVESWKGPMAKKLAEP